MISDEVERELWNISNRISRLEDEQNRLRQEIRDYEQVIEYLHRVWSDFQSQVHNCKNILRGSTACDSHIEALDIYEGNMAFFLEGVNYDRVDEKYHRTLYIAQKKQEKCWERLNTISGQINDLNESMHHIQHKLDFVRLVEKGVIG